MVGYGTFNLAKSGAERKKESKNIDFDVMPVFQIKGLKIVNMREHSGARGGLWRTFQTPKYILAVKSNNKTCLLTEISSDLGLLRTKFKKEFKSLVMTEESFLCEASK